MFIDFEMDLEIDQVDKSIRNIAKCYREKFILWNLLLKWVYIKVEKMVVPI